MLTATSGNITPVKLREARRAVLAKIAEMQQTGLNLGYQPKNRYPAKDKTKADLVKQTAKEVAEMTCGSSIDFRL